MDSVPTLTSRPVGEFNVAIVSDEPEFARALLNRWQAERTAPSFTVVGPVANAVPAAGGTVPAWLAECDLVVLGGVAMESVPRLQSALAQPLRPVICVLAAADCRRLHESLPQLLLVPRESCWEDNVVSLAAECTRRLQATLRAQRAEQLLVSGKRHTALGKYVLEMRHNINNSLTSVLGNSDLLLLEEGSLSAEVREQLETIRNNALRLHEIMQRFWSLESEMRAAEDDAPEKELRGNAAAGSR
jgi:signal transduction histidine kinase